MRRLHFAAERLNTSTLARSANRCLYALDFHFTLSDAHPVAARFQPIHDVRVYGHLRFKEVPLIGVIVASWLIAFVEYCVAVPANRWGSAVYTTAQLNTIQEVITLLVFAGFSVVYLKEPLTWNYAIGFGLIALGAFFVLRGPL